MRKIDVNLHGSAGKEKVSMDNAPKYVECDACGTCWCKGEHIVLSKCESWWKELKSKVDSLSDGREVVALIHNLEKQSPAPKIDEVDRPKINGSEVFNNQFNQGEFDLYCPLCGGWLHAYHLGDPDGEEEATTCLDCRIEVRISHKHEQRELKLIINDGSGYEFKITNDSKSASKRKKGR